MLKFNNVNLYINDVTLFENLNLEINAGEIHVLMGKNGVGKSSIAKTIMGDSNYKIEGNMIYNDIDITKRIKEIGNMHGIGLLDHIIIGDNNYYSFFEDDNL